MMKTGDIDRPSSEHTPLRLLLLMFDERLNLNRVP